MIIASTVGVGLLLVVGGWLWWRVSTKAALARELDRIRAEGYPTTAAELEAYQTFAKAFTPRFAIHIEFDHFTGALLEVAATALAVAQFQIRHGRWPRALEELAPDFIEAISDDRFAEGPLKYVVSDDGVIVYSVGKDGQDDGGCERNARRWAFSTRQ